jgi:hypothetical protein
MRTSALFGFGFITTCMLAACAEPKPPPPKPAPPPAAEPPPPKCDDLAQGCTVKPGRRAKIGTTSWTVELPNGWTFAEEPTLAVAERAGASVAITAQDVKDAKKETVARDDAWTKLTSKLAVNLGGKNASWPKKPQRTTTVGSLKVSLFQLDAAERGGKKGPLLLFATKSKEGVLLVGAGFVPDDDASNADAAILKCIESLTLLEGSADAGAAP